MMGGRRAERIRHSFLLSPTVLRVFSLLFCADMFWGLTEKQPAFGMLLPKVRVKRSET